MKTVVPVVNDAQVAIYITSLVRIYPSKLKAALAMAPDPGTSAFAPAAIPCDITGFAN
jgi:hypothetical protein